MKNTQQGSGTITAIVIVVLLVIIGLWVTGDKNSEETIEEGAENAQGFIETGLNAIEDAEGIAQGAEESAVKTNAEGLEDAVAGDQAVSGGTYTDYSEGVLAQGPETQVLFFHASWCPSCRTLEKTSLKRNLFRLELRFISLILTQVQISRRSMEFVRSTLLYRSTVKET